jgi:hypothetical protein
MSKLEDANLEYDQGYRDGVESTHPLLTFVVGIVTGLMSASLMIAIILMV